MSDAYGGTPNGPDGPSDGSTWDPMGRQAAEQRAVQARELVEAFARVGVEIGLGPDDERPDEVSFFYAKGAVLVRDSDAARVRRFLGLESEPPPKDPAGARPYAFERRRPRAAAMGQMTRIELPDGTDTLEVLGRLDAEFGPGVATPDHVVHVTGHAGGCPATEPRPATLPLDPPPTPDTELGRGVRVVVVDTGLIADLAVQTPWLTGVTGDEEDQVGVGRYRGHGTFIAGVVRTMAPAAEVDIEAFLYAGGGILESDLAHALARALESMPDIISMSAGATTRHGHPLMSLQAFWHERLRHAKGTVLVCAAGNDGNRGPFWPAAFPWAVSVGALDASGQRAPYSNFGSWVDVWARGSDVVNAFPTGPYTYGWPPREGEELDFAEPLARWSGTSFSTPLVAGLVAARMSWSGESAREAATALLQASVRGATRGVGAVLAPGMADAP